MITEKAVKIVSMGVYLPRKVESAEIENRHHIPSGWSEKYSGVSSRHHVTNESNGSMGAIAAERALEKAGIKAHEIDMLISCGATFDFPIPNQGSVIKSMMKEGGICDFPTIDVDCTCLGFVVAIDLAARILNEKGLKTILIVSSEVSSKGLDLNNHETVTLFGDGAVAALVSLDSTGESTYIKGAQKTYSEGVYDSMIKGGGNENCFKNNPYTPELYSFKMNGKNLLKLAKSKLPIFFADFFKDLPLEMEGVDVVIPHQASKFGVLVFENLYKFKPGQVKKTLSRYGNCISASIPLTLAFFIENGEIKRGDLCLLCGTSAGFSIGAVLIKY